MEITLCGDGETLQNLLSNCSEHRGIYCGMGKCGKCRLKILEGESVLTPITEEEKSVISSYDMAHGVRLACMARLNGSARVSFLPGGDMRLQDQTIPLHLALSRGTACYTCSIPPQKPNEITSDFSSLKQVLYSMLNKQDTNIACEVEKLANLACMIRENQGVVHVVYRQTGEILEISPEYREIYGLALDLGTTKIAMTVVDLNNGLDVGTVAFLNPLVGFGEDVLTRAAYTLQNPEHNFENILWDKIDRELSTLCRQYGVDSKNIYEVVAVGNTAMQHLSLGLSLRGLVYYPYVPVVSDAVTCMRSRLHCINPSAFYTFPPILGEFIGSDALGALMAADLIRFDGIAMVIDIGTNTEIIIGGMALPRVRACSTASGPAFEGANISHGMRAEKGAIEAVRIDEGSFSLKVIGDIAPLGICGSGIVDLVAELRRHRLIDRFGKLESPELELSPGISLTQKDVENVLLAKAATKVGIELLLDDVGISLDRIDKVFIAGAFGNYLDIPNAKSIGLLPLLPDEKFALIGNGALAGAKGMLLSHPFFQEACGTARDVTTLCLSSDSRFAQKFGLCMLLS